MTDYINQDENKTENLNMGFGSCKLLGGSCNLPGVSHRCSQTDLARLTSESARRIFCVHLCFGK